MSTADRNEQDEIAMLLPWYAAGTLSRADAQRVERALAGNAELARQLLIVREELGETIQLNEQLGAPSPRAAQKLMAAIDVEPEHRSVSSGLGARIAEFFGSLPPRALAWSAALAVVAILLQAGFLADLALKNPAQYETASVPAAAPGEGAFVLMSFRPGATAAAINEFLDVNKLSVVDGPSAGGIYRVKVAAKPLPKDALAAITKKLQEDTVVGFIAATE